MSELSRHDLYELCVQSPRHLVPFLKAVHGGGPLVLGEDFAGTAALSRLWAESDERTRAIAADLDAEALFYHSEHERVARHERNVLDVADRAEVIFVGNFSIGYWHTRAELVAYLRHARARLAAAGPRGTGVPPVFPADPDEGDTGGTPVPRVAHAPGVFLCDTYGGESAFLLGDVHRDHWIPDGPHKGKRVRYTWEQRHADPVTGRVTDVLHFRVQSGGVIEQELFDAFVYEWRLWSVPELRDAMLEAGFASTEVYAKTADAVDEEGNAYVLPVEDGEEELDDSFIVLIAGRV